MSPTFPQRELDLGGLIDQVLEEHTDLRAALRDAASLAEVAGAAALIDELGALAAELEEHMIKEERVLLPWIRAGRGATAGAPIRAMLREHEHTLGSLAAIRELTSGHRAPTAALAPLYACLARLDRALEAHIALENDVLFPRALRG